MLNTGSSEILSDDNGDAVGIKLTCGTCESIPINTKAVVLTTCDIGADLYMVVEYKPELKGFMSVSALGIVEQRYQDGTGYRR